MSKTYFCKECYKNSYPEKIPGYMLWFGDLKECPHCKDKNIVEVNIPSDDVIIIANISKEQAFIEAMVKLYESDPIEYQLKMSQFKAQQPQKPSNTSDQRKCPHCNSTAGFTPVKRNWSFLRGFATNKVDLICNNCGKRVEE